VDVGGYFDPINADSAGIDLKRLLWVRCIHKANAQSKSSKNQSSSNANAEISGTSIGPSEIHQKRLRSVPQIPSYIVRTPGVDEQQLKPTRQLLCASQERSSGMRKVLDAREDGVNACTRRDESYSSKVNNSKKQRLNPLEQAFKAADILIQNGGFGLIAVDLRSIETKQLAKVPLTTWFRFARVAEKSQTSIIFLTNCPAQNFAGATLHIEVGSISWSDNGVLWSEESTAKQVFNEAAGTDVSSKLGYSATVAANQTVSHLPQGTSDEEVVPARSGSGKKKCVVSHAQIIKGADYAIDIKRGRKPVQSSSPPKFGAVSKWK